jgi:hypothetical protein
MRGSIMLSMRRCLWGLAVVTTLAMLVVTGCEVDNPLSGLELELPDSGLYQPPALDGGYTPSGADARGADGADGTDADGSTSTDDGGTDGGASTDGGTHDSGSPSDGGDLLDGALVPDVIHADLDAAIINL